MELKNILEILRKASSAKGISKPYIVGGLPRDKLLGRLSEVNDIDLTTGDETIHNYAEIVSRLLKEAGQEFSFKEMPDGHRQIQLSNVKLDFSSNFRSPDCQKLLVKAGVKNPSPLQIEMFSRDFTCNTLLMSLTDFRIYDLTGMGVKDIKNKILRTPLPPRIALADSPKRIIRTVYLASKLGFSVEPKVIRWISKNHEYVKSISGKYIQNLLRKSFKYNKEIADKILLETGLNQIFK